jgi:hypothetical protein
VTDRRQFSLLTAAAAAAPAAGHTDKTAAILLSCRTPFLPPPIAASAPSTP